MHMYLQRGLIFMILGITILGIGIMDGVGIVVGDGMIHGIIIITILIGGIILITTTIMDLFGPVEVAT